MGGTLSTGPAPNILTGVKEVVKSMGSNPIGTVEAFVFILIFFCIVTKENEMRFDRRTFI